MAESNAGPTRAEPRDARTPVGTLARTVPPVVVAVCAVTVASVLFPLFTAAVVGVAAGTVTAGVLALFDR